MSYEHHVFVSYNHGEAWNGYVRDIFVPTLRNYLQLEVAHPEIFVDDQIQTGARWQQVLKQKVARSKLMLPLISAGYFHSEWCRKEMAMMLERQELNSSGVPANFGLLIPVRLGDGDCFPETIRQIQYLDFGDYADPDLPPRTQRASDFNMQIRELAKTIAATLPLVPDWSDDWNNLGGVAIFDRLAPCPMPPPAPPRFNI